MMVRIAGLVSIGCTPLLAMPCGIHGVDRTVNADVHLYGHFVVFSQVRATETFKTPGVRGGPAKAGGGGGGGEEGGQCSSARGDISFQVVTRRLVVAPTPPLSEFSSISPPAPPPPPPRR